MNVGIHTMNTHSYPQVNYFTCLMIYGKSADDGVSRKASIYENKILILIKKFNEI